MIITTNMATITKVNSINRRKTVIKRKEDIVVTNKHTVLQSGSQPLKRMVFKGKYIKINIKDMANLIESTLRTRSRTFPEIEAQLIKYLKISRARTTLSIEHY